MPRYPLLSSSLKADFMSCNQDDLPLGDYDAALALALKRIHAAERSEAEVRVLLGEFGEETVERVVSFLKERRIIHDPRFAQQFAEMHSGKRAMGDRRLRDELSRRGIDDTIIDSVLQETENERERIRAILKAKYKPGDSPAKAGRYLYSKGFDEDAIEASLSEFFAHDEQE
jgi:regulatory protein